LLLNITFDNSKRLSSERNLTKTIGYIYASTDKYKKWKHQHVGW